MSQENVEIVRGFFESWNRGEGGFGPELLDEGVVWDARGVEIGGEFDRIYYGRDGVAAAWREWLPAWRDIEVELVWIKGTGDRVVAWLHQRQTGRRSGIPQEWSYAWDVLFRDGKIVRMGFFRDEAEALDAVTLRE